ncbi:MAG: hypothetical protein HYZ54_13950 [Ignavibacteriae bacterium]|nr:hypothetical protein [Ignavibacteriota bacterium]
MSLKNTAFNIINNKTKTTTSAGSSVIYITDDPSWNVMTYTITNNTTDPLVLKGGDPVNSKVQDGASSFVVDFSGILSVDQVAAIKITDDKNQWGFKLFPSSGAGYPSAWALAPLADLTIAPNDKAVFTLNGIKCNTQAPGNFDVKYFNIANMSDRSYPYTYQTSVLNPPTGIPLPLDFGFSNVVHPIGNQTFRDFLSEQEYTTPLDGKDLSNLIEVDITYDNNYPIKNGFTINLTNPTGNPLEPDGTDLGNASVYISFVFATDDPDAITNQSNGDNIQIGVKAKSTWKTVLHQAGTPSWQFIPQSSQVFFGNETAYFNVSNLITELNAEEQTISTVKIQFNNIPGYQDTVYTMQMIKVPAVASIAKFSVLPTSITVGDNVKLNWQTEVAWRVTLEYFDRDGGRHFFDSAQNQIRTNETDFVPNPAPNKEITEFTLCAYDNDPDNPDEETRSLTVNQLPVVINSFTPSVSLVDISSTSNTVTISWNVSNAQTVTLQGVKVAAVDSQVFTLTKTIVFSLIAFPYGVVQKPVQQSFTVYVYRSYPSVSVGPAGDGNTWQSLPLSLVNKMPSIQRIYVSNAYGGGQISQVSEVYKALIGGVFPGNIMALSKDGSRLYIEQSGPTGSKITVYDTSSGNALSSVAMPAEPPCFMALSPDQTLLFALKQHLLSGVNIFNVNVAAGTISYRSDVTVQKSPVAAAFANGNAYIANYDGDGQSIPGSISVVSLSSLSIVATINLPTGEPRAFQLIGNYLYVACEGGSAVAIIDVTSNAFVAEIQVGGRPFSLIANSSNTLLFVTNFASNSVSVIDVSTRGVIKTISVGNSPAGMCINDNGSQLFVSNYCDKSITVIDLTNGTQNVIGTIQLEKTNGNPVDISSFQASNGYNDIFIAKEYFNGRNPACSGTVTDQTLNMSILSIQENYSPVLEDQEEN